MPDTNVIKFGTDGWRALIARDYTFANVRYCAEGVCRLLREQGLAGRGLVIGHDTRYGSADFAAEAAQVAAGHGIHTYLFDRVTPTPVTSYNLLHRKAGGGIVITASHNSGAWNGFKYKPEYAGSASPEVTAALEGHITDAVRDGATKWMPLAEARAKQLVEMPAPAGPYLANLARILDLDGMRNAGLRIVVDSMHGAGGGYLAGLLYGGSTRVTEVRGEPDPLFPGMGQPEPITQNLWPASAALRGGGHDVGLATDGDADRLGVLGERGEFITTLQTFSLLALHYLEVRKERGPLVRSLTQSAMLDRLGERYGVPVHVTPVGFKYVGPVMMREDALAAGEESGGYAFRGNIPERDGILSALLFLELMVRTGKRPSELVRWLDEVVGPHFYDRWDVRLGDGAKPPTGKAIAEKAPNELAGLKVERVDTTDGARFIFERGFWGLVRPSGTEPLLRIYAEADSPDRVKRILGALRETAGA
ncbi:MAG: phosphoglucomutase/phosphomannomutase family protein [SAR202 cluster bacterium]|nr:phosphoglucomutase/phosphomannomutase family protein [SAR202 cluster bacterium]